MRSSTLFALLTVCLSSSVSGLVSPSTSRRTFLQQAPALIATTAAVVLPSTIAYAGDAPVTGAKAPTFQLPNSRGEGETSLDQLIASKKWTVLYFYPGAFTQGN
jgi:thioredoxin-dependent peroxiredoxin